MFSGIANWMPSQKNIDNYTPHVIPMAIGLALGVNLLNGSPPSAETVVKVASPILVGTAIYGCKVATGVFAYPENIRLKMRIAELFANQGAIIGGLAVVVDKVVFGGSHSIIHGVAAGAAMGAGIGISSWKQSSSGSNMKSILS